MVEDTTRQESKGVFMVSHRAAGGDGRGDLARDHAHGEVPGGDRRNHAHRLLDHQHAPLRVHRLQHVPRDAAALLRKPLD